MLWSLKHQFLFVHVPKAAGTSVRNVLQPFSLDPREHWLNRALDRVGIHVNRWGPFPYLRFRIHDSIRVAQRHLPPEIFARLFKFAFVRNPWDTMVSLYSYIRARPDHHRHCIVRKLANFEAFVDYELRRGIARQVDFLTDESGSLLVDFVGRFEHLNDDFAGVCDRLGIRQRLDRANASRHADYRSFYSDRAIEQVAEYFAADIQRFGYSFEGTTPNALQPAS